MTTLINRNRAEASGISLSPEDVAIIKGMLARGDRQHDIASWFGINGGRVAEIHTGMRWSEVAARQRGLPPQGPYANARETEGMKKMIRLSREKVKKAMKTLHPDHDSHKVLSDLLARLDGIVSED